MKIVSLKNCAKVLFMCLCANSYAQDGIGIGTTNPKALLDVYSNDAMKGGILIPRYNADDLLNINLTEEHNSMLVYITSPLTNVIPGICENMISTGFYYYNHSTTKFLKFSDDNNVKGWSTTGNTDVSQNNFLGTINDAPLKLKINNLNYGVLSQNSNIGIGYDALLSYSQGTTEQNVAIGRYTMSNISSGKYNIALGSKAMINTVNSNQNIAFGYEALSNVSGSGTGFNIAMGYQAIGSGINVINNISLGRSTLSKLVTGGNNIALGNAALSLATEVSNNIAIGQNTLSKILTHSNNNAIGYNALQKLESGENNIAIGSAAGRNLITGSNNIVIGYDANLTSSADNTVILGNSLNNSYKIWSSSWTYLSDQSAKHSISQIPVGLDFIKSLKPVEYIYNNETNNSKTLGFVAQEMNESMKQFGLKNYGLVQQFDENRLGLRLNDLFPIITKAIQEQQEVIEKQQQDIDNLKKELDEIKKLLLSKK